MKKAMFVLSIAVNIVLMLVVYNAYVLHLGVRTEIEKLFGLKKAERAAHVKLTYESNPRYLSKLSLYDVNIQRNANIVMLGDSITENAAWNELMNRSDIANMGIGSDVTAGFLNRLDYVYKLNPEICFMLGGINDMCLQMRVKDIFDNYKNIVLGLKSHNIIPVIQSVTYTANPTLNNDVKELNKLLKRFAKDNNVDYIDLNSALSENELLRPEYTYDGTHLTGKGYAIWRDEIDKILKKYNL